MTFFNSNMDFRFGRLRKLLKAISWLRSPYRDRIAQRMNPIPSLEARANDQPKWPRIRYPGGRFSQLLVARYKLHHTLIWHPGKPALHRRKYLQRVRGLRGSSVLCPSMKQQLEWWLGSWRDFYRVGSGKLLVLMGCWRRLEWCCNPGGQRSQLSRFPKPRQLNATRPCEPPGPQGHEPEGEGAEFRCLIGRICCRGGILQHLPWISHLFEGLTVDKAHGNWGFWHHFRTWSKTKRQCSVRWRISREGGSAPEHWQLVSASVAPQWITVSQWRLPQLVCIVPSGKSKRQLLNVSIRVVRLTQLMLIS